MLLRRRLTASLLPIVGLLCAALAGAGLAGACFSAGCGDPGATRPGANHGTAIMLADASQSATPAAGSDDHASAEEIFTSRCVACHGADGRGNGPASGSLRPGPINFHDEDWQKTTSDETIAKAIVEGGAAVGMSSQMIPNPDLEDQPGTVKALITRIRGFVK
jgi:mono/diheme cytochrome c family protein